MKNKSFSGLVLGCGDVGGRLARKWAERNWSVWGLRRGREVRDLGGMVAIQGELTAPEGWINHLPSSIDCVVFTAAGGGGGESRYREVYVEGTRIALESLQNRKIGRVVWCSSTGVYAENSGEWVDESTAAEAKGWRGRLVREGEIEAERWCRAQAVPLCVVRLGGIYGPGRVRMFERIERDGPSPRPESGQNVQWTNRIHVEDAAGLLEHLSGMQVEALPSVVVATDGNPAPKWEVEAFVAQQMGWDGGPESSGRSQAQRSPFGNKRCSNRLMMSLGYRLKFPDWRNGYQQLIDDRWAD